MFMGPQSGLSIQGAAGVQELALKFFILLTVKSLQRVAVNRAENNSIWSHTPRFISKSPKSLSIFANLLPKTWVMLNIVERVVKRL